jgi:hypothetical protein
MTQNEQRISTTCFGDGAEDHALPKLNCIWFSVSAKGDLIDIADMTCFDLFLCWARTLFM